MGKTTIELPDELLLVAKRRALDEGTTLKTLVERSLRRELSEPRTGRTVRSVEWVVAEGGLPRGLNVASREAMHGFLGSDS